MDMNKAQVQAVEAQDRIRALAVAAGLMTQREAEAFIIVQVAKLGEGAFKDAVIPTHCDGCGAEHSPEEWVPLEIGISNAVSDDVRDKIMLLLQHTSGPAN